MTLGSWSPQEAERVLADLRWAYSTVFARSLANRAADMLARAQAEIQRLTEELERERRQQPVMELPDKHPLRIRAEAAEATVARLTQAEKDLRCEWWMNHGSNCHPYRDDGEMHCCGIDFKRHPLDDLRERTNSLRWKRMNDALLAARSTPQEPTP